MTVRTGLYSGFRGNGGLQIRQNSEPRLPPQSRAAEWEAALARRPRQALCVLVNHRVWYSQRREGPCGRNRRAGACPSQGPDTPPPHPSPLIHSLCSPPPLLRRLQCVLRLVQAKPFPLRNSLGLFLLCSFISYFFLFTLRLFFFCIILIWRLKHSSFLTHLCMLLSCHIKGLNARLFEKIAGVTLHC